MAPVKPPTVVIFPWGDVIEEYLDPLNLTIEDYAGRMRGGWLFGYAAGLQARGWRPIVMCASEAVAKPTRLEHAETGAPIWIVPGRRSHTPGRPSREAALRWLRSPLVAFARLLRREGCVAVVAQDYEHARFDALALMCGALGLPLWTTFQGGDVTLSPLEARVRGISLRTSKRLIVPSERERERLQLVYGLAPDRLVDVPNSVDASVWQAEPRLQARAALGVGADDFLVVNHGRIDIRRKGLDVLLAAWSQVAAARPNARLVLIGSGQDHAQFEPMARTAPGVTWLSDYVTEPAFIRRWLSAADAYVTLSRVEGLPVAPLEAMSCGLPVVSSDAHGLADIFRTGEAAGGLKVPREDPGAAAAAMLRLADDPALRPRLGQAARATIEARYDVPAVGAALAGLLEEVVRPPAGSRSRRRSPPGLSRAQRAATGSPH